MEAVIMTDNILAIVFILLMDYIITLLLLLLWCTSILLDTNKWLGMIIYLIICLLLVNWLVVYYAYCCTPAFVLSIFGMKWDFSGNTTLLGDFFHPFFFSVSIWRKLFPTLRWTWLSSLTCWIIGFYYMFWIVLLLWLLLMTRC